MPYKWPSPTVLWLFNVSYYFNLPTERDLLFHLYVNVYKKRHAKSWDADMQKSSLKSDEVYRITYMWLTFYYNATKLLYSILPEW